MCEVTSDCEVTPVNHNCEFWRVSGSLNPDPLHAQRERLVVSAVSGWRTGKHGGSRKKRT